MSLDPCVPCGCIPSYINDELSFRSALLQILCGGIPINPVTPAVAVASTQAIVAVGDTSTAVLAANPARIGGWVKNISDSDIFVSLSGAAATNKPTLLGPGSVLNFGIYGMVNYTGAISAIHAVAGQTKNLEVVAF